MVSMNSRKGRKLLLVLLPAANLQLIEEDPGVYMNGIRVQGGSFTVSLDERVTGLNQEEDVLSDGI